MYAREPKKVFKSSPRWWRFRQRWACISAFKEDENPTAYLASACWSPANKPWPPCHLVLLGFRPQNSSWATLCVFLLFASDVLICQWLMGFLPQHPCSCRSSSSELLCAPPLVPVWPWPSQNYLGRPCLPDSLTLAGWQTVHSDHSSLPAYPRENVLITRSQSFQRDHLAFHLLLHVYPVFSWEYVWLHACTPVICFVVTAEGLPGQAALAELTRR